jgi:hypothetical protein
MGVHIGVLVPLRTQYGQPFALRDGGQRQETEKNPGTAHTVWQLCLNRLNGLNEDSDSEVLYRVASRSHTAKREQTSDSIS